jgi:hypothetical protein
VLALDRLGAAGQLRFGPELVELGKPLVDGPGSPFGLGLFDRHGAEV